MKRRTRREEQRGSPDSGSRIRAGAVKNPESKMSEALFNLSVKDRNAIEEEVHGVSCMAPDETPEFLDDALEKFHLELTRIDRKPAYDRAQELMEENPPGQPRSYIHAKGYKLRFLRCELFDARKAAKRYIKYLDVIFELHGDVALKRPIRMTDLNREEMSFLRKGINQVLPVRDRSGRRIMCVVPNSRDETPKEVLLKVYLYIWSSVLGGCEIVNNDLEQLETQRKGVIVVFFPGFEHVNQTMRSDYSYTRMRTNTNKIVGSIVPVRMAAVHMCLPDIPWANALSSMFELILSQWLPRTKFHFGNHVELRYQLQGFGVPSDLIPSTDTGNVKSANLKQWIKLRAYLESQAQQPDGDVASDQESTISSQSYPPLSHLVECPGSNDVLFRRGKAMNYHPGNAKFLNLIELRIYEHTIDPETTPTRRMAIEMELIHQIRQDGGRFLKWEIDKGWWTDISYGADTAEIDKEIQSKVHYAFRDFRKKMIRPQQEPINNTSSTYVFARDGQKRLRYNSGTDEANDGCIFGGSRSVKKV